MSHTHSGAFGSWSPCFLDESSPSVALDDADGIEQAPRAFLTQVGALVGVTAVNGGDNLGVYIPVFAEDFSAIPAFVLVFAVMTLLWCVPGHLLVSLPRLIGSMRSLSRRLQPYVLIVLGVWILSDAIGLVLPAAACCLDSHLITSKAF